MTLIAGSFLLNLQHTMPRVVMLSHSLMILLGLTQLEMANLRSLLLLSSLIQREAKACLLFLVMVSHRVRVEGNLA
jgi:hypothetical protein